MPEESGGGIVLATVTHARLRVSQGDVRGARRILEALLSVRPNDSEARSLLDSLSSTAEREASEVPDEIAPPPVGADPAALRGRFRVILGAAGEPRGQRVARRLQAILRGIDRSRRVDDAR
ncbi:MAG: hypothetical protein LAO51_04055 [Acidobacteriia bacterium]|nr:hypothetical protein [Terriglobia bacterium]